MRSASTSRIVGAVAAAIALSACGGGDSPTAPDMPAVMIATGAQVLRITYQGQCPTFEGRGGFFPFVYTHVTVTRSGSEWIARATSSDAGTVELRIRQSGAGVIAGSMPVQGSIRGVAIHSADLVPGVPPWNTQANFGDGSATLNGFAFSASALTPAAGTSGVGAGTVTFSDNDSRSCSGSSFVWSLASRP